MEYIAVIFEIIRLLVTVAYAKGVWQSLYTVSSAFFAALMLDVIKYIKK